MVGDVQVSRLMDALHERDEEVAALEQSLRVLAGQHTSGFKTGQLPQSLVHFLRGGKADRVKCVAIPLLWLKL
jgi:hypothetical protein